MIARIWYGWTSLQNASAYESLLKEFAGSYNPQIQGFTGIEIFKRDLGAEVEFITLMRFDSLDAVRSFAGGVYETAVVPRKARELLSHFDECSQHYEIVDSISLNV